MVEPRPRIIQIRASDSEHARWHARALAAGKDFSTWARDLFERAMGGGQETAPPRDRECADAIEELRIRYGVRDPAEIVRMAVMAAARRDRAGVNPWLPVALKSGEEPSPPSPPSHPAGKRRT